MSLSINTISPIPFGKKTFLQFFQNTSRFSLVCAFLGGNFRSGSCDSERNKVFVNVSSGLCLKGNWWAVTKLLFGGCFFRSGFWYGLDYLVVTGQEVVVVGYGTQRREAVTGSVASMSGDKIRDVPSSNITQALQGRVSGVDMEQTSTKPGATMQIRIRGTRSLNASNDPLVVLDGIPFAGSIGDISTSDIKSIDILKDASATAIYGSRGANGVILITTNKGLKGQKAKVTYNGYYGVKNIFAQYPMMNGPEFRALRTAANMYPIDGADESDSYNTNWQDLFYRTGAVTSHDLGVSGGTEKGNYNFGVGYYKDEAVIPGQDYSRFSFRGTLDQEVGKFFRFGFTTNSNYSITNE